MDITSLDFAPFLKYIKNVFNEKTYEFEVAAIDFWCLNAGIEYETIYITPEQNDNKVDGIVIPKKNRYYSTRNYYVFQISTGTKSKKQLQEFYKSNPLITYPSIIPSDANCKRVVMTIGTTTYENDNIEFICGDKLSKLIYRVGTNYNIINNNNFSEDYLDNVEERAKLWRNIHKSKTYNSLFNEYSEILSANHDRLGKEQFKLMTSFSKIIENKIDLLLNITTSNPEQRFIAKMKGQIINDLGLRYDQSKENLLILIGKQLGFNSPEFLIKPTIKYLSIKLHNRNIALAHLDWGYDSITNKYAFFGFKCPYSEVTHLDSRIKDINDETVNNYLNFAMNSALIHPRYTDGELIKTLILKSSEYIKNTLLKKDMKQH